MITTVMVDMDGTLLTNDKKITESTIKVIKEFQSKGGKFVINTGRGYATTKKILDEAGISCDCICMSGAAIYSENGECIVSDSMTKSEILAVREVEKKYGVYVNYISKEEAFSETTFEKAKECYLQEAYVLASEKGITIEEDEALKAYTGILNYVQYETDIDSLILSEKEIFKMVFMCDDEKKIKIQRELNEKKIFLVADTGRFSFEINAKRVDKGQAALVYAVSKGIPMSEIMVIGDSGNDKAMLQLTFGRTVAMENATEEIKEICTDITLSNMEDGVAYAIEQWILKK